MFHCLETRTTNKLAVNLKDCATNQGLVPKRTLFLTAKTLHTLRVQELCGSGGGRPGLPSLLVLVVSVALNPFSQTAGAGGVRVACTL